MGCPALLKEGLAAQWQGEWPAGCLPLPASVELAPAKKNCLTWGAPLPRAAGLQGQSARDLPIWAQHETLLSCTSFRAPYQHGKHLYHLCGTSPLALTHYPSFASQQLVLNEHLHSKPHVQIRSQRVRLVTQPNLLCEEQLGRKNKHNLSQSKLTS